MTDLDDAAQKLATKATLRAARDAASKALEDALLTDEERAQRKVADAAAAKRKRQKVIVFSVVGLLLVLGIVGLVISYWHWFLLAGLVGLVALYGRYRWRKRRGEKPNPPRKVASPVARVAIESAAIADDTDVEDELRALKARVKR
jgi:Flp pilus assembly protein TadB